MKVLLLIILLYTVAGSQAMTVRDAVEIVKVAQAEADGSDPLPYALTESMEKAKTFVKMAPMARKMVEDNFIADVKEKLAASGIEVILPYDCGRAPRGPGTFPWLVALGIKLSGKFIFQCVGALISESHVLIDGACATSPTINVVHLNVTKLPDMYVTENFVAGRRFHPGIRSKEDFYHGINIGIIELGFPVQFDDFVQPICLPGMYDGLPAHPTTEGSSILGLNLGLALGFTNISDSRGQRSGQLFQELGDARYAQLCELDLREKRENVTEPVIKAISSILSKDHICFNKKFEEYGRSVLLELHQQSFSYGVLRAVLTGIGPVANAQFPEMMLYTRVQSHRFWVNLIVRKFQRYTAMKKSQRG